MNQGAVTTGTQRVWGVWGRCAWAGPLGARGGGTEWLPARSHGQQGRHTGWGAEPGERPCAWQRCSTSDPLALVHLSGKHFTLPGRAARMQHWGGAGASGGAEGCRGGLEEILGLPEEVPRAVRSSDPGLGLERRSSWLPILRALGPSQAAGNDPEPSRQVLAPGPPSTASRAAAKPADGNLARPRQEGPEGE